MKTLKAAIVILAGILALIPGIATSGQGQKQTSTNNVFIKFANKSYADFPIIQRHAVAPVIRPNAPKNGGSYNITGLDQIYGFKPVWSWSDASNNHNPDVIVLVYIFSPEVKLWGTRAVKRIAKLEGRKFLRGMMYVFTKKRGITDVDIASNEMLGTMLVGGNELFHLRTGFDTANHSQGSTYGSHAGIGHAASNITGLIADFGLSESLVDAFNFDRPYSQAMVIWNPDSELDGKGKEGKNE